MNRFRRWKHSSTPILPLITLSVTALILCGGCTPETGLGRKDSYLEFMTWSGIDADSTLILTDWRYHPGDEPGWSDPSYDDSSWPIVDSKFTPESLPGGWPGIGWFRTSPSPDSSFVGKPVLLNTTLAGACEIYLDGRLIASYGTVGTSIEEEEADYQATRNPAIVTLDPGTVHTLAVRYSFHLPHVTSRFPSRFGFFLVLEKFGGSVTARLEGVEKHAGTMLVFAGVFFAVSIIHFLFYFFYPRSREHLSFALLTLALSMMPFLIWRTRKVDNMKEMFFTYFSFNVVMIALCITGLRFLYGIFYDRVPRSYRYFLVGGIVVVPLTTVTQLDLSYLYATVAMIEFIRILSVAVYRKKDRAWLIGSGFLVFVLSSLVVMMLDVGLISLPVMYFHSYLYGAAFLILCWTIYIAENFGRTNRDLEQKIIQTEELSRKTIEQERHAKEEDMARKLLEKDLAHKEKELEKARELREAHERLEKAHRELHETQSQLVQTEKMAALGRLVAGIAHEINNPIGAVNSMHATLVRAMERLKGHLGDDDEKLEVGRDEFERISAVIDEANRVIEAGNARVAEIVRRLRSFARLDEAELKKADIHEGLDETIELISYELKDRVSVKKHYGRLPPITCYPSLLNQVFLNLLVNATQSMSGEGTITIETSLADDTVKIVISDTGAGIPAEHIPKIFDPGFTTKGVGVGTGLGLSICYQIIERHRGRIRVDSEVGKGTTFTILLPTDLENGNSS